MPRLVSWILAGIALLSHLAWAALPLQGGFTATHACPAFHSIKKGTNPGQLRLTPGLTYPVTGQNQPNASFYQIRIRGQNHMEQRWVAVSCGDFIGGAQPESQPSTPGKTQERVLAVSWQPAFCEMKRQATECRDQTPQRHDATHFSLHGLWPQPRDNTYCGIDNPAKKVDRKKRWDLLPALDLDEKLRAELRQVMPGMASGLHRHEWYKHGTCHGDSPTRYFEESLALMKQLNQSPARTLFVRNIGKRLTTSRIRRAFDQSFGPGAGRKVSVQCNRKGMISELWIYLGSDGTSTSLAESIQHGRDTKSTCTGGRVDAAGF